MARLTITSRRNPHIGELAAIAAAPPPGRALAEGWHLAEEAFFKSTVEIAELCLTEEAAAAPAGGRFLAEAEKRGIPVCILTPECYGKITQLQHPECIAAVVRWRETPLEALLAAADCRLLVAAGVQDPGNAGALARLAEAAGLNGVLYAGGVNPRKGKFLRAAMGSAFRLPCISVPAASLPAELRARGIRILAAAKNEKAVDYRKVSPAGRWALVVGAEGLGVPPEFLQAADEVLFLPMAGQVESLNVAVAAGAVLYRLVYGA